MAANPSPQYPEWVPGVEIDHVGAGRAHAQSVFPEASLLPSSVEMTLMESLAVVLGPVALSFLYAPSAVVEHFMGLHGMYRHKGLKAVGKARFLVTDSVAEVTVPAGTVLRHSLYEMAGTLEFRTTETIKIITIESNVGEAWIEATETGTSHNDLAEGARLDTVNWVRDVQSVQVAVPTRDGEDPETDDSFRTRAIALLASQGKALTYAYQFEAATRSREEVGRVTVVDNWNPTLGTGGGTAYGHVTVAVTGVTGHALGPDDAAKQAIEDLLNAQALASLIIHVVDPTYTTVDMSVTVEAAPGTNHAEVQTAVAAELTRRLDPLTWDWWNTINPNDVVSWVDDVPGVARVITVPAAITLSGVAPLPLPGTMTVTVNESTR